MKNFNPYKAAVYIFAATAYIVLLIFLGIAALVHPDDKMLAFFWVIAGPVVWITFLMRFLVNKAEEYELKNSGSDEECITVDGEKRAVGMRPELGAGYDNHAFATGDKEPMPFEREHRYYVLKIKDVKDFLNATQEHALKEIMVTINSGRLLNKKELLETVVVEHDWPEYETVWKMIEERMTGNIEPIAEPVGVIAGNNTEIDDFDVRYAHEFPSMEEALGAIGTLSYNWCYMIWKGRYFSVMPSGFKIHETQ